jgi:hypothetical protein
MGDIVSHYQDQDGPHHWFDADTMRFFRSRLPQSAYANNTKEIAYFVTSEQFVPSEGPAHPRKYTVRSYDFRTRDIGTVGKFQQYRDDASATAAAKELAEHQQVLP